MRRPPALFIAAFVLLVLPFTYVAVRNTNIIPSRAQTNATGITPTLTITPTITGTIFPTMTLTPTPSPTIVCKSPAKTAQFLNYCDTGKQTVRTVYYTCLDDSNGYYTAKNCVSTTQMKSLADGICTTMIKPVCAPPTPTITINPSISLKPSTKPTTKPTGVTPIRGIEDLRRYQQNGTGTMTCNPESLVVNSAQATGVTHINGEWKDINADYPAVDICMQTDSGEPVLMTSSTTTSGSYGKDLSLAPGHTYTFSLTHQRLIPKHCAGNILSSCQVAVTLK